MDTACKRALVDLRVQLLSGLRCDKRLMDHLASTKVVDVEQSNWILQPQSDEEQARRLLDLLPKLGEHAWTELLKGLRKSGPGTNSELCEKLERQVQLPATVRTVSSEAETGSCDSAPENLIAVCCICCIVVEESCCRSLIHAALFQLWFMLYIDVKAWPWTSNMPSLCCSARAF